MSGQVVSASLTVAETGQKAAPQLQCVRVLVDETIGQPYKITLDLLAPAAGLEPAKVIGTGFDVTYAWQDADGGAGKRVWSGAAIGLVYIGRVLNDERPVHYRMVLVPRLALGRRSRRSRAFVAAPGANNAPGYCTAVDAIRAVVQAYEPKANLDNIRQPAYPPREFITQFQETDLNFVARLAETYGISLFWSADTGSGSTLYLTDNNNGFQPLVPIPTDGSTPAGCVPVNANAGPASAVRAVYRASMRFGQMPAQVAVTAWKPPTAAGTADGAIQRGAWPSSTLANTERFGVMRLADSRFDSPDEPILSPDTTWETSNGHPIVGGWWDTLARIRAEQLAAQRAQLIAASNLEGLFAGCAIRFAYDGAALSMVPNFDANSYVVESISHVVMAQGSDLCFPSQRGKPGAVARYRNRFQAVPVAVTGNGAATGPTYRPPSRARRARVPTLHHATVVTATQGQLFPDIDTQGRYLVQPDFPLEYVSGGSAPPPGLRVPKLHQFALASIARGGDVRDPAGLHMPLRPGQAVLLAYNAGDPDQPMIAGLLPDLSQPTPVTSSVSGQPRQSVLRTASGLTVRLTDSV